MPMIPKTTHTFCTFFDSHFLIRGLALYESLREHCASFDLFVLCMDRLSYDILSSMKLPGMVLIALEDFEKGDEALLRAKETRSRVEYYFTCTPSLPLFILNNFPSLKGTTYLDADLFFFADPRPVYEEIDRQSIALIPHRFERRLQSMEERGIYNVGFLHFHNDRNARAFLDWWRNQCLEWCYDRIEAGRFADQKYLDGVPELFESVTVVQHKGANLAPWNLGNYPIAWDGSTVWVDNQSLLFYHFHGLKRITHWLWDPNLTAFRTHLTKPIKMGIYQPYLKTLSSLDSKIPVLHRSDALHVGVRYQFENSPRLTRLWVRLNQCIAFARFILNHQFILWMNGKVL